MFQYNHNLVYKTYVEALSIQVNNVDSLSKIPFLPIEFFKNHQVISSDFKAHKEFMSSGTTGISRSIHYLDDLQFYHNHTLSIFTKHFNKLLEEYCIIAVLPSYLEQGNSSLITMVDHFIQSSHNPKSGYYLEDHENIESVVKSVHRDGKTPLIIGVTYALLRLAEVKTDLEGCLVLETGGMKGRRKEIIREELHQLLKDGLNLSRIGSEYGMTELLSQAYSDSNGTFMENIWLKVLIRDTDDPFSYVREKKTGGVNVIDLANIQSCCFIETKDLGRKTTSETFEILGRFDNSDIRGCNLLVS